MENLKVTAKNEPEQRPVLDDLFDGTHSANERLSVLNTRLRRITDKVFGPRPEEAPKPGQPTASGVAPSFRDEVEALHRQLDRADQQLTHLERFV